MCCNPATSTVLKKDDAVCLTRLGADVRVKNIQLKYTLIL